MKSSVRNFIAAASLVSFVSFMPGDDCTAYVPAREGAQMELRSFTEKDKLNSINRMRVVSVAATDKGKEIQIESESFDKKEKPLGKSTYAVLCENGKFMADMRSMVSADQMANFTDMEVNVEADRLEIPANAQPGMSLNDGNVTVSSQTEGNPINMKFGMAVTNRKVAAIEDVTVPAGTFKCVKITYDTESKIQFSAKGKGADWYARDIGLVRSESYTSKGKLMGYTVLQSLK
jgi:hypothetical protein